MADEQATSPSGEVAQDRASQVPETARDEPRDDNAAADQASIETETDGEGREVTVDEVELDVAGTKHKIKKGTPIEETLELVQQYGKGLEASLTRKGQELGERSKAVEAQFKLSERLQGLRGESLAVYAHGVTVQQEIERLSQVDTNALWRTGSQADADYARRVSDRLGQLRSERAEIESSLTQYGEQLNQAERHAVESRAAEGEQIVRKAIKGFSPQVESEMVAYAVKRGVSEQDAKMWRLNPYAAEATWKSIQYDKMMAKGTAAAKPVAAPAPEKPVTSIKGGRGSSAKGVGDLESMSMDDYAAFRRRQDRAR